MKILGHQLQHPLVVRLLVVSLEAKQHKHIRPEIPRAVVLEFQVHNFTINLPTHCARRKKLAEFVFGNVTE